MKKAHKIEIRQKEGYEEEIMTGANTQLLLDGKPLKYVHGVKFEVKANGVARITLDMIANVTFVGSVGDLVQEWPNPESSKEIK